MVGISAFEQGTIIGERYRVANRLTRFAVADSSLTGVEYEYWLALDETRGTEVWLQLAASRGTRAGAEHLSAVVAAMRRLNHPAVPVVLDFGEVEFVAAARTDAADDIEAEALETGELDADVDEDAEPQDATADAELVETTVIGYVVLEPVEGESLATALLRDALTEAEVIAVLAQIAEVLAVLHEVGLVHGHLSAYSFLLTAEGVLLIDLAASLGIEAAAGGALTAAADVYAFAWLACIALAGIDALEAEFGVGFDAGSSPEDALAPSMLTLELIERRRIWAEQNLVGVYGVEAGLAALLMAGLGESAGRPRIGELATALRTGRSKTVGTAGVAAGAAAAGVAAAELVEASESVGLEAGAVGSESAEAAVVEAEGITGQEAAGGQTAAAVSAPAIVLPAQRTEEAIGITAARGAAEAGGAAAGGAAITGALLAQGSIPGPRSASTASSPAHKTPRQHPRSAFYTAVAISIVIVVGVVWALASHHSGKQAPLAGPSASTNAAQSPSAEQSPSAAQSATLPAAPSASPTTATSPSSATGGATGPSAGTGASASAAPSPLATIPGSPSQAVQQIQQAVGHAESSGQLTGSAAGKVNQAVSTVRGEVSTGRSVTPGASQLENAIGGPGVPSWLTSEVNQLIPYLVPHTGS